MQILPRCVPLVIIAAVLFGACGDSGTPPLAYDVVERDSVSLAAMGQVVYRVAAEVDEVPGEEALRETALAVWEREAERGADWEEVVVMVYLPGMEAEGEPYMTAFVGGDGVHDFVLNAGALAGTPWANAPAADSLE